MIRDYQEKDCKVIAEIYNFYILNTHHTFETEEISENEMKNRITTICLSYPFIVYEESGEIVAYAYATRWKSRQAYDLTVETSIYLKKEHSGRGIGSKLCTVLIEKLKESKIHSIIAGISLPNQASISLHEKLGFTKSGVLKEVGFKFEKWIDVGYWQLEI